MSRHSLLPITYSEFLDWYNRRSKQFLGLRLIPAELGTGQDDVQAPGEFSNVLVNTIPEYDEDFQVLIALLEGVKAKKYKRYDTGKGQKEGATVKQIDISSLKRLYPITERGSRLLESRLDDQIYLGPPLFEDAIEAQDLRRNRQQARAGGNALIELYDLEEMAKSLIDDEEKEEILDAVRAKVRGGDFAEPASMLGAVVLYDRQDKPQFPSTSIGSIYDYFSIVRMWHKGKTDKEKNQELIENVLKPAQKELKQLGRKTPAAQAVCTDALTECFQELETVSPLDVGRCPPRAAVLFLDLRDQLRQSNSLDSTSVDEWGDVLRESGYGRELAFGLWMVGAFFNFSTFADDYYRRTKPSFMKNKIE